MEHPRLKRFARAGLTLLDPESTGVYLTLWPVNTGPAPEWAALVLCADEELILLDEETPGCITYILTRWIEYHAEEP